jgi:hypothetical protein
MQLNEFLEKFSNNDAEIALAKAVLARLREDEGVYYDLETLFKHALQNFTDKICEKQRENCLQEARIEYVDWEECVIDKDYILDAEQPKIDEL